MLPRIGTKNSKKRSAGTAIPFFLLGRADHVAVGAEHTALPGLGFHPNAALHALITGFDAAGGHGFFFGETASRAF